MMTAAGTVTPSKVLILGAGVAGLQAIATAKRLGAVVSAYDVRLAAKEEVESLGAKFVVFDEEILKKNQTEEGYAKEMTSDYKKKQENQGFCPPKTHAKSARNAFNIDVPQNMHFFVDFLLILVVFGFVRFFFEVLKT